MSITQLILGLSVLRTYTDDAAIDYAPNSFPNGTPDHPLCGEIYLNVETGWDVSEEHAEYLRSLGWHSECEGQFWCLRQRDADVVPSV